MNKSVTIHAGTDEAFERERHAFLRQRPRLLRSHAGEYVAFHRGRLVGHDRDDEALAGRMFAKYADASLYIARVEAEPTVWEFPSPELTR